MRTLQLLGFILAIAGLILGYIMLTPVDGTISEASAGAAGIGLIFMVLPMLGWSACMLVPSSIALFSHSVRQRSYFSGKFWLNLWKVNLLLSVGYIACILYIPCVWFQLQIAG